MNHRRTSVIKELAAAASAQSQVANRYWIALSTVAVVAVTLRPQPGERLSLLGLGPIEAVLFYPVIFGVLVVLMIAFASAHAQQIRVQRLGQRTVDRLGDELLQGSGVHPRDLFDALRLPSVTRLAPLAQLMRGRDSFFDSPAVSRRRRRISALYYLILKAASWPVYFGFPALALWFTFTRVESASWLARGVLLPTGIIASWSVAHVFIEDVRYVVGEVLAKMLGPTTPEPTRLQPRVADDIVNRG